MANNTQTSNPLRNLFFVRAIVQAAWAAGLVATARHQPALAAGLFLLYPLWDVACTVFDLQTASRTGSARTTQTINALLGILAAIGIGVTAFRQPVVAVAVFGAWALGAGVLQLAAGLIRRRQQLGGQWAMILSGAQSTVAGIAYIVGGLAGKRHITDVAGYITFGALYFLVGAILLTRRSAPLRNTNPA